MDIQFCDLCNESVPQGDLEVGRAYFRKGRLICTDCDVAMGGNTARDGGPAAALAPGASAVPGSPSAGHKASHRAGAAAARHDARAAANLHGSSPASAPETVATGGGGGAGGVVVGLLAIVFATAGFWLVLDRLTAIDRTAVDTRRELQRDLESARRDHEVHVAGLPGQFGEWEQRVHATSQIERDKLAEQVRTLRDELKASAERENAVASELRGLRDELDKQDRDARGQVEDMKETIISLSNDIRFYSDRMIELEETLRTLSTRGVAAMPVAPGGAQGGAGAGAAAPTKKAWEGLLADLKHTNAGIRLDAIYALGETGDKDVIPSLIPMLTDVDLFVRMATARMLEDLDARSAVPALIDALEDSQSAVREASMVALRQITGKDFRFEPVASDAERGKKVKLWRDWWKKSGDSFLAGA